MEKPQNTEKNLAKDKNQQEHDRTREKMLVPDLPNRMTKIKDLDLKHSHIIIMYKYMHFRFNICRRGYAWTLTCQISRLQYDA